MLYNIGLLDTSPHRTDRPTHLKTTSPHRTIRSTYSTPFNKYRSSSLSRCGLIMSHWINDCVKWCLICCDTNVTTEQYYETSNEKMPLSWMCNDKTLSDADASLPVTESTRLSSDFRPVIKFIHRLIGLPFLPAEHITPMYTSVIAMDADITPMPTLLCKLVNYIQTTWT